MNESDFPIPPPNFAFLVMSLRMQAETHLGLNPFAEENSEPDLRLARHAIDLMSMLKDKTQGNLTMEEQRLIENSITELRFRYVQATEDLKAMAAQPKEPSDASDDAAKDANG